jgi:flagellar biosynthesis protein FlhA
MLQVDRISLEIAPDLEREDDPSQRRELLGLLSHVRRRIAMEFGVIVPSVQVRAKPFLERGEYEIRVRGDLVGSGQVNGARLLGIGPDPNYPGIGAEPTTDPIYDTPAVWLPRAEKDAATQAGIQVFEPHEVICTHVAEIIK